MRFFVASIFLAFIAALGNCRPAPTMADACAERAFTTCDLLASCQPIDLSQRFGDHDTCVRRLALECTTNAALPGAAFSPADVEDCAHELSSGGCDALGIPAAIMPACSLIQRGGRHDGQRCGEGIQCRSGGCDMTVPDQLQAGCGRCGLLAQEGTPCGPTIGTSFVMPCDAGLYCNPGSGRCLVPGREGEPCYEGAPGTCDLGLVCAFGFCQRKRGEGDDCSGGSDILCDRERELVCDAGRCVSPSPACAGVGDVCDPASLAAVACGPRALCVEVDKFGTSGTCKAVLDDGASCDPSSPVELCLFPARCIDGQCGLVDPPACSDK